MLLFTSNKQERAIVFLVMLCTVFLRFQFVESKSKCVVAIGRVVCPSNTEKANNVEVRLMDWDGVDPDDSMGITETEEDGGFRVEGCGYDFGPWNQPDPYLRIWHKCTREEGSEIRTDIQAIFRPEINDFGTIYLE